MSGTQENDMPTDLETNTRYRAVCRHCGDAPVRQRSGYSKADIWSATELDARVEAVKAGMRQDNLGWVCGGCAVSRAEEIAKELVEAHGWPSGELREMFAGEPCEGRR